MTNPLDQFLANDPPKIDDHREEAARCAEETAKYERGEREALRTPLNGPPLLAEFSDAAFGIAAEVAMTVGDALRTTRRRFKPELAWSMAAQLLRNGWQRGHRIVAQETGKA